MAGLEATSWSDVALRRTRGQADPDAVSRAVLMPATWDQGAADALASLAPGEGPVSLPRLAEAWIRRAAAGARSLGLPDADTLADALRELLLLRRGAPGAESWADPAAGNPRFVLSLPAFLDAEAHFDADGYAAAVQTAVLALEALTGGKARALRLGFADLAGLLAGLGLDYDSPAARDVAAAIAALTRGAAEAASGECAEALGERVPVSISCPPPPAETAVPGLAFAAREALNMAAGAPGLRHESLLSLSPADAAEALLGAETAGLAPAAGPTHPSAEGEELPTAAALRAGPRAAILLAPRGPAARAAMQAAVGPFLHADAPASPATSATPRPAPRHLDSRTATRGHVWKVSVGGHRVTLRTAEHADGTLAEMSLSLAKDSAPFRGLLDALCQSVSLGLARGVPLAEFVHAHAYTHFGPSGAVEGDPTIRRATSILDWAFRRLALEHLDAAPMPDPSEEEFGAELGAPAQQTSLPLEAPASPRSRRRALRLVG
ncbi:TSCPD domain-containing protein [Roseomonas elaeocarpi]|uniref:ribonucleoside-diphosphate reductase n=1 Tax=Roseomonas elaeocarpi TaxID=907779 RepID=A0ABV6JXL2_9PROT